MRQLLLFFSAMLLMFGPLNEARADGDDEQILIYVGEGGTNNQGPIIHAPALIPMSCYYSAALSSILVNYQFELGATVIEIENQTTGEYNQTLVNALAGPMVLPISGTAGQWTITFTLSSGTVYYGEFTIY